MGGGTCSGPGGCTWSGPGLGGGGLAEEKISLLVNYVSFARKIFNIFESLIENVSVRGEGRRG